MIRTITKFEPFGASYASLGSSSTSGSYSIVGNANGKYNFNREDYWLFILFQY